MTSSSIRPAWPAEKMAAMKQRLITQVSQSRADITVHVSSWEHDTEQGAMLPSDKAKMRIYSFSDHRLAFYLDSLNQLELIVQDTVLVELGVMKPTAALAN